MSRTVSDLLRKKSPAVWTVGPDDTVYAALKLMADRDVGAVPVIGGGRLVGIFSERDYARRGILHGRSAHDTLVGELMTSSLFSCTADQSLDDCMLLMVNKHVRHLPVLDDAGRLIAVLSIGDVLKAVIAQQQEQIVCLKLEGTGQLARH